MDWMQFYDNSILLRKVKHPLHTEGLHNLTDHFLYFSLKMLIDIGYVGDWFAALVDDEAGTTLIWELIDAFGRDDFDKLDLPIFGGNLWQIVID